MTVCYIGNSFKYETEAVLKLFLPIVTFDFLFEEYPQVGDFCIIKREPNNDGYTLSVTVSLDGTNESLEETRSGDFSDKDDEAALCKMLYLIMQKLKGVTPAWGLLTGIRPVKKVNELLDRGLDKAEIFSALKEKYFVSDEKLELAYSTAVTQADALAALDKRSYSLYVSIPFCPSRCSYCSFVSHSIESAGAKKLLPDYVKKLCEEIAQTSEIARELGLRLDTIYIGGGTPTALSAEQLEAVMSAVKKNFDISKIREYTVEAGRSDTITEKKLEIIRDFGATRISVNPQTMNDAVLEAIGRRHTAKDVVSAFDKARRLGFGNINMDVIAGLPTDTPESFLQTIETLCGLDPESITIHTLTVKRSSKLFSEEERRVDGRKQQFHFENENKILRQNPYTQNFGSDFVHFLRGMAVSEMVLTGQTVLLEKGYLPYYLYRQKNTVDNLENVGFAKAGYECLYNIYIMEEAQTILAVGAGGSTKLVNTGTGKIERLFNYKFPYEYISRYDKMISKKDRIAEFFAGI
ncbi:MAG: coproporphyrinogen dehydrogenase HemZ [Oscillospiraceae bacterium]|nr:coproporphyrinogen dehydrogenase HemZ [Oscillospiraceae bacterium]